MLGSMMSSTWYIWGFPVPLNNRAQLCKNLVAAQDVFLHT